MFLGTSVVVSLDSGQWEALPIVGNVEEESLVETDLNLESEDLKSVDFEVLYCSSSDLIMIFSKTTSSNIKQTYLLSHILISPQDWCEF